MPIMTMSIFERAFVGLILIAALVCGSSTTAPTTNAISSAGFCEVPSQWSGMPSEPCEFGTDPSGWGFVGDGTTVLDIQGCALASVIQPFGGSTLLNSTDSWCPTQLNVANMYTYPSTAWGKCACGSCRVAPNAEPAGMVAQGLCDSRTSSSWSYSFSNGTKVTGLRGCARVGDFPPAGYSEIGIESNAFWCSTQLTTDGTYDISNNTLELAWGICECKLDPTSTPTRSPSVDPASQTVDLLAWQTFYTEADGANWLNCGGSDAFNFPCLNTTCSGDLLNQRVICASVDGKQRIVEIVLRDNLLRGVLSGDALRQMTELKYLDVSNTLPLTLAKSNAFFNTECVLLDRCFTPAMTGCFTQNSNAELCTPAPATFSPTTFSPSLSPVQKPSRSPTSASLAPSLSTSNPTRQPSTQSPSRGPSTTPSKTPTRLPTSNAPSKIPTSSGPTQSPSLQTNVPTKSPTFPTSTISPTQTSSPTIVTKGPSMSPNVATVSPTTTTTAPSSSTNSPTVTTNSPTGATNSPTVTTNSPTAAIITNSPTGATNSPTVTTSSPSAAITNSPTSATNSPTVTTNSPTAAIITNSPTSVTNSPTVLTTISPTLSPTPAGSQIGTLSPMSPYMSRNDICIIEAVPPGNDVIAGIPCGQSLEIGWKYASTTEFSGSVPMYGCASVSQFPPDVEDPSILDLDRLWCPGRTAMNSSFVYDPDSVDPQVDTRAWGYCGCTECYAAMVDTTTISACDFGSDGRRIWSYFDESSDTLTEVTGCISISDFPPEGADGASYPPNTKWCPTSGGLSDDNVYINPDLTPYPPSLNWGVCTCQTTFPPTPPSIAPTLPPGATRSPTTLTSSPVITFAPVLAPTVFNDTLTPTKSPTRAPIPTQAPVPTFKPSRSPSKPPTPFPTKSPTTRYPTKAPTLKPTPRPISPKPTYAPGSRLALFIQTDHSRSIRRATEACTAESGQKVSCWALIAAFVRNLVMDIVANLDTGYDRFRLYLSAFTCSDGVVTDTLISSPDLTLPAHPAQVERALSKLANLDWRDMRGTCPSMGAMNMWRRMMKMPSDWPVAYYIVTDGVINDDDQRTYSTALGRIRERMKPQGFQTVCGATLGNDNAAMLKKIMKTDCVFPAINYTQMGTKPFASSAAKMMLGSGYQEPNDDLTFPPEPEYETPIIDTGAPTSSSPTPSNSVTPDETNSPTTPTDPTLQPTAGYTRFPTVDTSQTDVPTASPSDHNSSTSTIPPRPESTSISVEQSTSTQTVAIAAGTVGFLVVLGIASVILVRTRRTSHKRGIVKKNKPQEGEIDWIENPAFAGGPSGPNDQSQVIAYVRSSPMAKSKSMGTSPLKSSSSSKSLKAGNSQKMRDEFMVIHIDDDAT